MTRQPYILCVDDDPSLRLLLRTVCEKALGARVAVAAAADEARSILAGGEVPDLVLLDVMMPGTDGYSLCKQLRQDRRYDAVPIVFISAATGFDQARAGSAGADGFLAKPFQVRELGDELREFLAKGRGLPQKMG